MFYRFLQVTKRVQIKNISLHRIISLKLLKKLQCSLENFIKSMET